MAGMWNSGRHNLGDGTYQGGSAYVGIKGQENFEILSGMRLAFEGAGAKSNSVFSHWDEIKYAGICANTVGVSEAIDPSNTITLPAGNHTLWVTGGFFIGRQNSYMGVGVGSTDVTNVLNPITLYSSGNQAIVWNDAINVVDTKVDSLGAYGDTAFTFAHNRWYNARIPQPNNPASAKYPGGVPVTLRDRITYLIKRNNWLNMQGMSLDPIIHLNRVWIPEDTVEYTQEDSSICALDSTIDLKGDISNLDPSQIDPLIPGSLPANLITAGPDTSLHATIPPYKACDARIAALDMTILFNGNPYAGNITLSDVLYDGIPLGIDTLSSYTATSQGVTPWIAAGSAYRIKGIEGSSSFRYGLFFDNLNTGGIVFDTYIYSGISGKADRPVARRGIDLSNTTFIYESLKLPGLSVDGQGNLSPNALNPNGGFYGGIHYNTSGGGIDLTASPPKVHWDANNYPKIRSVTSTTGQIGLLFSFSNEQHVLLTPDGQMTATAYVINTDPDFTAYQATLSF